MTLERNPVERERLARMQGSWRADKPSDFEIETARTRWLSHAHIRPARSRPGALLVLAVVFGAAGALAATGAVTWPKKSVERPLARPSISAQPSPQPRSAPIAPRAVAAPRFTGPPAPVPAPRQPEAVAASKHTRVTASDSDVQSAPRSDSAAIARFALPSDAPTPTEPATPVPIGPEHSVPIGAEGAGAWQRAADALRQGDDRRATQALQELSSSSDPYTRDTAALAKAQLDAAAGRWDVALPVLRRLATQGSTPLLRRRAGEVLAQGPRPQ